MSFDYKLIVTVMAFSVISGPIALMLYVSVYWTPLSEEKKIELLKKECLRVSRSISETKECPKMANLYICLETNDLRYCLKQADF